MMISVLSPVYNEEHHVREMVGSIQSQTHSDWEIVFVDDGSTDGTADVIEELAASDSRIRLISRGVKHGKAAAFNLAYQKSRGEVVVLLAGDDRLPVDSLAVRAADLGTASESVPTLACYKLRSFSEDRKMDDMVLPRGDSVSQSGGVLTMNRALGDLLFPVPEVLPSEDLWLGYAAPLVAEEVVRNPVVIMEYRIHGSNSNPRGRPFAEMSRSMAARHEGWRLLAESGLPISSEQRRHLKALYAAEGHRRAGRLLSIARAPGLSRAERASLMSMGSPALYSMRNRFYRLVSGRQNR